VSRRSQRESWRMLADYHARKPPRGRLGLVDSFLGAVICGALFLSILKVIV
jgi:hypothetical protein